MSRLITAGLVAATLLVLLTGGRDALAHARYEDSTPAKGAVLQDPPSQVEITFSQDIQRISGSYGVDVNRDRGASVTAGPAVVDDDDRSVMSVPLQPALEPGRYVVNWKNVSDDDGDPAEGAFSFYYDYEPNAVDLANDEQLALIGEENETPASAGTGTAAPATTVEPTQPPAASLTPSDAGPGDDGDDGGVLWIAVAGGIAAAVIAGAAVMVLRSRAR